MNWIFFQTTFYLHSVFPLTVVLCGLMSTTGVFVRSERERTKVIHHLGTEEWRFFHTLPHSAFGHFLTTISYTVRHRYLTCGAKYRTCAVFMPSSPRVAVVDLRSHVNGILL